MHNNVITRDIRNDRSDRARVIALGFVHTQTGKAVLRKSVFHSDVRLIVIFNYHRTSIIRSVLWAIRSDLCPSSEIRAFTFPTSCQLITHRVLHFNVVQLNVHNRCCMQTAAVSGRDDVAAADAAALIICCCQSGAHRIAHTHAQAACNLNALFSVYGQSGRECKMHDAIAIAPYNCACVRAPYY